MMNKTILAPYRVRFLLAALALGYVGAGHALPTGPQIVAGTAVFSQNGNALTISNSNNAILSWQQFNIAAGEAVRFNQPSIASSVLNRVFGPDPSSIYGQLSSNGRVWLINPAGILVGAGARIDTAGFVASTLNLKNEDFLAGKLTFGANGGSGANAGSIVNQGTISTPDGGSVYLIAPDVTNQGIITTPKGETILAAGQSVKLIDTATPGVNVEIVGSQGNATNLGSIVAEAGRIGMAGVLVKNSGTLNASSVVNQGGRIFLKASQDTYIDKTARLDATGSRGGSIDVLGNRVAVTDDASIDVSGSSGGGSIRIGGDFQGKNPAVQNALMTYFGAAASAKADAIERGDGGKITVWADDITRFYGSGSARGGAQGGNGGFAEVSGKRYLDYRGLVDLRAPRGEAGTLLLDPNDITITNGAAAAGSNVTCTPDGCAAPTTPGDFFDSVTAPAASMTDGTLNAQLQLGNASVTTSGPITTTGTTIDVNSKILTLDAGTNISLGGTFNDTGAAGTLALKIGQAGANGTLTIPGTTTINAHTVTVTGGAGANDIIDVTRDADLTLTSSALTVSGAYTLTSLSNIESVKLTGGAANNAIDVNAWAGKAAVVLSSGSDTIAGNGSNTLVIGTGQTYTLDNAIANKGGNGTTTWTAVGNLTDTGTGIFNMGTGGSVTGNLDGGSGGTLNYGSYGSNVTLDLSGTGTTGIGGSWSNIATVTGNSAKSNTVTGAGQSYTLTGADAGNNSGVSWTAFKNLTDTGTSSFVFNGGSSLSGALSAGATSLSGTTSAASMSLGAVTLSGDTTLGTSGGDVTFTSTIDGTQNLTINPTGSVSFGGAVGGTNKLSSLTINTIGASRDITVTNVNDRINTNNGTVDLHASGLIDIGGAKSDGGAVTINAGGNLVVREIVTSQTSVQGSGGNINLTSGGYMTLGGGQIDARKNVAGSDGNVTLVSGGAINVQNGKTIYGSVLKMTAAGGIGDGAGGAVSTQVASLNDVQNTTSDPIKIANNGPLSIIDLGATGYGINQTTTGDVSVSTLAAQTLGVQAPVISHGGAIALSAGDGVVFTAYTAGSPATGGGVLSNGGSVTITATGNTGLIDMPASALISSTNGDVTLKANNMAFTSSSINAGSGAVKLNLFDGTKDIQLGVGATDAAGTRLGLTDAELKTVTTSGTLLVGASSNSGAMTLTGALDLTGGGLSGTATLNAGTSALAIGNAITVPAALGLVAGGAITEAGSITASALSATSAGGVDLTGTNSVSSFAASNTTSGNINFKNSSAINLGTISNAAAGGAITIDAGSITLNASNPISTAAGAVNLYSNGVVTINSPVSLSGGAFKVVGSGGVGNAASFTSGAAGTISTTGSAGLAGGSVDISTSGAILTQAITTGGGTSTAVGNAGGNVSLHTVDGNITTGTIVTSGSTATDGLESPAGGGSAGSVTIQVTAPTAARAINVGAITAIGGTGGASLSAAPGGAGGAGGDVVITTTSNGGVTTAAIDTSGAAGGAGPSGYGGGHGGGGATITLGAYGAGNNVVITGNLVSAGGSGGVGATTGGDGAHGGNYLVSSAVGSVTMKSVNSAGAAGGSGATPGAAGADATSNAIYGPTGVTVDAGAGGIKFSNLTINNPGWAAPITLTADRMDLGTGTTINAGSGTLWLKPGSTGWNIDLGSTLDSTANTLELSAAELDTVHGSGILRIGATTAGNLHLSGPVAPANFTTGTLSLESSGTVTQATSAIITASKLAIKALGGVSLDTEPNVVTNLAAQVGDASHQNNDFKFKNGSQALNIGSSIDGISGISATGSVSLNAVGPLGQTAAISTSGLLTTSSAGGTTLNSANTVGSFSASNSGSGDIALTNTAAPLTITSVANPVGAIAIENTGAVITSGAIYTTGAGATLGNVTILAHSPLTIGSGGIAADGTISLTAGTANSSSSSDVLTINGTVTAGSGKTITLAGYSVGGSAVPTTNVTTMTTTTTVATTTTTAPTTTTTTEDTTTTTATTTTTTVPTTTTTTATTTTTTVPTTTTTTATTTTTTVPTTTTTTATTTTTVPTTTTTTTATTTTTTVPTTTTTTATTTTTTLAPPVVIEEATAPVVQTVVTKEVISVTAIVSKPASHAESIPPPHPAPLVTTTSTSSLTLLKTNLTIGGTEGTFGGSSTPTLPATPVSSGIGASSTTPSSLGTGGGASGTGGSASSTASPSVASSSATASTGGSVASSSGSDAANSGGGSTGAAANAGSQGDKPAADKPATDKPASDKPADKAASDDKKDDKKEEKKDDKKEDKKEDAAKKQEDKPASKKPAVCG